MIQLRQEGSRASAPMFIPFLGAVISASHSVTTPRPRRASVSPARLGSLATLVPLGIWLATDGDFWRALAYIEFFLNLFNLLPVLPLDGGQAMALPLRLAGRLRRPDRADVPLPEPRSCS